MRSPKHWFTTTPDERLFTTNPDNPLDGDDDAWWEERERREHRWFNRCYEFSGTRVRFIAGDVMTLMEHEGGGRAGVQFGVELNLCQEDIPEFYLPDNEKAVYDIHSVGVTLWRWGVYLSIRGRVQ